MISSVSESLLEYQKNVKKKEVDEIRSILYTCGLAKLLIPFKLEELKNQRLDYILDKIPISGFVVVADPIIRAEILQISVASTRKVKKSKWNRYCKWLEQQDWYLPEPTQITITVKESEPTYTHIPKGLWRKVDSLKERKERQRGKIQLLEAELPPHLKEQLASFNCFCTTPNQWHTKPMTEEVVKGFNVGIRNLLAYLKNVKGIAPEQLDLQQLIEKSVLEEYAEWYKSKDLGMQSIKADLAVAVSIAQWLFYLSFPNQNFLSAEPVRLVRDSVHSITSFKGKPLALTELSPHLEEQFQSFYRFCTTTSRYRRKPVAEKTLINFDEGMRRFLAYLKNVKKIDLEHLDLQQLVQEHNLKDYSEWCRDRGLASGSIRRYVDVAVHIAQWIFNQSCPNEDFHDAESVKPVRGYVNSITDLKDRPRSSQEAFEAREISMQQCWEILRYLGWRCKDLEKQHGPNSVAAIDAWQDYILMAILITTGGRQRESRELNRAKLIIEEFPILTIFVSLSPEQHKTGNKTDKGRKYPLFVGPMKQDLTNDFLYYINKILPTNLKGDHLFFTRKNRTTDNKESRRGDPIPNEGYVSSLVSRTIAAVTAHRYGLENTRWTTPHDFRRIIATWVCVYGQPKHLAIYAELLGHDPAILIRLYNKMHPGQLASQAQFAFEEIYEQEIKVTASQALLQSEAPNSTKQMSPSDVIEMLKKLVKKLWYGLTPNKRKSMSDILTPIEREVLEE
jgi:hypothetical protein